MKNFYNNILHFIIVIYPLWVIFTINRYEYEICINFLSKLYNSTMTNYL